MQKIRPLLFFIILNLTISLLSCNKTNINSEFPSCIQSKIDKIKAKEVTNPPTEVWKWDVDDNTYYYFSSDCCDQYNYLYNVNCNLICAPDGGITGKGDGNCPAFEGDIIKTLVWMDKRS